MNMILFSLGTFLFFLLYIGWKSSQKIHDFKTFANSKKEFSLPIMVTTYFATVIGGGSTFGLISSIHDSGFIYLIPFLFMALNRVTISFIIEKFGKIKNLNKYISFGDLMYEYYGRGGRILTGVSATTVSIISVGTQTFVLGLVFEKLIGIDPQISIFISFGIISLYSSLGGIRAVVYTDTLQFCMIVAIIPILLSYLFESPNLTNISIDNMFFMAEDLSIMKIIGLSFILFFGSADPSFLHRLFITKEIKTSLSSMKITGYISVPFFILISCIGLFTKINYSDLSGNEALINFISNSFSISIVVILMIAIISAVMSSADSDLNIVGISFVQDILEVKRRKFKEKTSFRVAQIVTLLSGFGSITVAMYFSNILDIMEYAFSFWGPGVFIPVLSAILGIKIPKKYFYTSVFVGISSAIVWNLFFKEYTQIPGFIPGFTINLLIFLCGIKYNEKPSKIIL